MLICPYCWSEMPSLQSACCGEYGHAVEVEEEADEKPEELEDWFV